MVHREQEEAENNNNLQIFFDTYITKYSNYSCHTKTFQLIDLLVIPRHELYIICEMSKNHPSLIMHQ